MEKILTLLVKNVSSRIATFFRQTMKSKIIQWVLYFSAFHGDHVEKQEKRSKKSTSITDGQIVNAVFKLLLAYQSLIGIGTVLLLLNTTFSICLVSRSNMMDTFCTIGSTIFSH